MDIHRRAIDRVREAIRRHDSESVPETAGPAGAAPEITEGRPAAEAELQRTREALREHDEAVRHEHSP